ncbi:hypothetical protein EBU95_07550 [bacterium]|nr:hypothetical protein [bacterium]
MINIIKYNNQILDFPTPIVETKNDNVYLNKPWGSEQEITLRGQLTGDFNNLQISQKKIIDIFSKNFKKIEILEKNFSTNTYEVIYEKDNIQVLDISFGESAYNNILDYDINLKISNVKNNVLSPADNFNFDINKDNTISLTHSVSAIGVRSNTAASNALANAINYVNSLSGLSNIPTYKDKDFFLVSVKESINRIKSSYSLEETYLADNSNLKTIGGINRYTIDISSGIKDLGLKISLQGQMTISKTGDFNNINNIIDPVGIVSGVYQDYFNPIPISYNIQENRNENAISYTYEFDNINLPNPYVRYNISEQYDNIYKIINKNISAEIYARGNQLKRINSGTALLDLINLDSIAGAGFRKIGTEKVNNKDKNTFVVSANFTDKIIPGNYLEGKYTVTQDIPIDIIKPNLGLNGYILQEFQVKSFPKTIVRGDFKGNPSSLPGVNASNFTKHSQSYDPETKSFTYNVEYYGGNIQGLPFAP